MRSAFHCMIVTALALALLGCGDDDGGDPAPGAEPDGDAATGELATLSIEFYWDLDEDPDTFSPGSCQSGGVTWLEWTLLRAGSDEELASRMEECHDALDVLDLPPGDYELEVVGFNEDDEPVWSAVCTDLTLAGEDVSYDCEIQRD